VTKHNIERKTVNTSNFVSTHVLFYGKLWFNPRMAGGGGDCLSILSFRIPKSYGKKHNMVER
jgi:hypothetical protein